mmetsp:Transcript_118500/g.377704  ORF Transcript_118500/g.377704 Transcript_118500/m.377704 type:complete len:544 (-) Transcript_118500:1057-2688(-)
MHRGVFRSIRACLEGDHHRAHSARDPGWEVEFGVLKVGRVHKGELTNLRRRRRRKSFVAMLSLGAAPTHLQRCARCRFHPTDLLGGVHAISPRPRAPGAAAGAGKGEGGPRGALPIQRDRDGLSRPFVGGGTDAVPQQPALGQRGRHHRVGVEEDAAQPLAVELLPEVHLPEGVPAVSDLEEVEGEHVILRQLIDNPTASSGAHRQLEVRGPTSQGHLLHRTGHADHLDLRVGPSNLASEGPSCGTTCFVGLVLDGARQTAVVSATRRRGDEAQSAVAAQAPAEDGDLGVNADWEDPLLVAQRTLDGEPPCEDPVGIPSASPVGLQQRTIAHSLDAGCRWHNVLVEIGASEDLVPAARVGDAREGDVCQRQLRCRATVLPTPGVHRLLELNLLHPEVPTFRLLRRGVRSRPGLRPVVGEEKGRGRSNVRGGVVRAGFCLVEAAVQDEGACHAHVLNDGRDRVVRVRRCQRELVRNLHVPNLEEVCGRIRIRKANCEPAPDGLRARVDFQRILAPELVVYPVAAAAAERLVADRLVAFHGGRRP